MIFNKLKKKIRTQIIIPLLLSLYLAVFAVIIVVAHSLITTFFNDSTQHMKQKQNNIKLFLDLIEETSMQFSDTGSFEGNVLSLDLIQQMDKNILGTAYIKENGSIYISSRTSGYPKSSDITSLPCVTEFLSGKDKVLWFIRNEAAAEYYNNRRYDIKKGVLTFVRREAEGLLIIDLDPSAISGIIDGNPDKRLSNPVIVWDGELLIPNSPDTELSPKLTEKILDLSGEKIDFDSFTGNKTSLFSIPIYNKIYASVEVSHSNTTKSLLYLIIPLAIVSLLLTAVAFFCSVKLTGTIINPLKKLYHKIKHEELTTVETE